MHRSLRPLIAALTVCSCLCVWAGSLTAGDKISVLLIDGQNNHAWKKTTPVLVDILEKSGHFAVDVATSPPGKDLAGFRPKFAKYDVVVSNYNGRMWPQETQRDFVEYMRGGGGFVVVHAADNAFGKWPEYNEIIGIGGWGGRNEKSGPYVRWRDGKIVRDTQKGRGGGHGSQHDFIVETREPNHPIMKGLPTRWLHAKDELYDKMRGPAKNLTVLATSFADPKQRGSGEHEPMLLTIDYGKGRCFHTMLGHGPRAMQCVGFQITLLRGTEWAASGKVTITGVPDDFPTAEKVVVREPQAVARAASAASSASSASSASTGDWVSLFDGKTLEGWTQYNGTAKYRVEDGAIVGTTTEGSPNSFLCSVKHYGDFELEFEVKVDDQLNSGVQIRSATKGGTPEGRVHGPQIEIAVNGSAGFVYGEALGTGWLSQNRKDAKKSAAFKKGAWNKYRVRAVGKNVDTWVNGVRIAELVDEKSGMLKGFIGLQVHGIRREKKGPFEVRWRNLRLREIGE